MFRLRYGLGIVLIVVTSVIGIVFLMLNPIGDTTNFTHVKHVNGNKISFMLIGDQGTGDYRQKRVAAMMEDKCRVLNTLDSTVLLGDNFYFHGVKSVSDVKWNSRFEEMYDYPCLRQENFFAILGNHDAKLNPRAQIEYSMHQFGTGRWQMPNESYIRSVGVADGKTLVRMVMLNTNEPVEGQLALLEKAFGNPSDHYWRVVFGHFNIRTWSEKYHGNTDLAQSLLPALKKYHVHFYVSGHSHNMQLINEPHEPIYVISGAGGKKPRPLQKIVSESLLYGASALGFVTMAFTPTEVNVEFSATNGNFLSSLRTTRTSYSFDRSCNRSNYPCLH